MARNEEPRYLENPNAPSVLGSDVLFNEALSTWRKIAEFYRQEENDNDETLYTGRGGIAFAALRMSLHGPQEQRTAFSQICLAEVTHCLSMVEASRPAPALLDGHAGTLAV